MSPRRIAPTETRKDGAASREKHALRVAGEEPTRFVVWRPDTRRPGGQPRPAVADVELGPEDQRIDDSRGVRFVVISARRSEARTGNLDDGVAAASPREPRAVVSVAGQVDARGDGGARDDRVRDVVEVRGRRRDEGSEGSVVRRRNVSFAERFVRVEFFVRGRRGERAREPFAQRNRRRRRRVFVFVRVVEDSCSGRGSFERSFEFRLEPRPEARAGHRGDRDDRRRGTERWLTYNNPARRAQSLRLSVSASAPSPQRSAPESFRDFGPNETNEKGSHRNTQAGVFPSALSAAPRRVAACCPAAACALRRASCARVRSASAASSASANASASASHTAAARATRGSASTSSKSTPPRPSRSSSAVTRARRFGRGARAVERDATRSQNAAKRKSSSGRGSYPASNATSTEEVVASRSAVSCEAFGSRTSAIAASTAVRYASCVAASFAQIASNFARDFRYAAEASAAETSASARASARRASSASAPAPTRTVTVVCASMLCMLRCSGPVITGVVFFGSLIKSVSRSRSLFAGSSKGSASRRRKKNTLRRRRRGRAPPP